MEDKKMLDIIHNNCKKEQIRRAVAKQNKINQYNEEQQQGKKWCKLITITGIICVLIEVTIIIMERVI